MVGWNYFFEESNQMAYIAKSFPQPSWIYIEHLVGVEKPNLHKQR
jgi:hypothetical protein